MKTKLAKTAPYVGALVRVENYPGAVWRVLALHDKLADLTKINADPRVDYRDVPVARLTVTHGVVA